MARYMQRTDQFTEGQKLPGHQVNIGLHYVATPIAILRNHFRMEQMDAVFEG
jgi:hypothetical protein